MNTFVCIFALYLGTEDESGSLSHIIIARLSDVAVMPTWRALVFCVSFVWQGIPVSKKQNVPLYISFIKRMHACEQTSYITIILIISVDRHILRMLKNNWVVILAPNGCGKIYIYYIKINDHLSINLKVCFFLFPKEDKLFVNNYMYRNRSSNNLIRTDGLFKVFWTGNDKIVYFQSFIYL